MAILGATRLEIMKTMISLLTILLSYSAQAQEKPVVLEPAKAPVTGPAQAAIDSTTQRSAGADPLAGEQNEYEGGAAEYKRIFYTPAYVSKMISDNMKIQCFRGLCEMSMVDTRGEAFVVEVAAGYGNQNQAAAGMGGGIVVLGNGGFNNTPQPFFGVTVRYVNQHCKQSVRVPTSLYVSLNTYLYSLINEDGSTRRTFDPATQTMILFYTTILKQTTGCTTSTR
jgi:hypothetical protein